MVVMLSDDMKLESCHDPETDIPYDYYLMSLEMAKIDIFLFGHIGYNYVF